MVVHVMLHVKIHVTDPHSATRREKKTKKEEKARGTEKAEHTNTAAQQYKRGK
jgi:hypothetical protein